MNQPPAALDPNFRIELPNFEGPLDLLLHLIKKHELDVLDLPIAFVTDAYLQYISLMKTLNLDVASEYLVMAATLAHIKSKMLLPKPPADQDEESVDEGDPREELIKRLLEYQKYKKVAAELSERGIEGRDAFTRGSPPPSASGQAPLAEVDVFRLIDAFQNIVKRRKGEISLEISAERITIQQRISSITSNLRHGQHLAFAELFDGVATTYDLVVTFLALLEMAKMRMLRIYQDAPDQPLNLEYRVLAADAVLDGDADASFAYEGHVDAMDQAVVLDHLSEPPNDAHEESPPMPQDASGQDADEAASHEGDEPDELPISEVQRPAADSLEVAPSQVPTQHDDAPSPVSAAEPHTNPHEPSNDDERH